MVVDNMIDIDTVSSFYLSDNRPVSNKSNIFAQEQSLIYNGSINFYIPNQEHLINMLYYNIFQVYQKEIFLVDIKNGDLFLREISVNGSKQDNDSIYGFKDYRTLIYKHSGEQFEYINLAGNINDYIGVQAITSIQLNGSSEVLSVTLNISLLSSLELRDKGYLITKSRNEYNQQYIYFLFNGSRNIFDKLQLRYIYTYSIGSRLTYDFDKNTKQFLYKPALYHGYGNKNLQISSQYNILDSYDVMDNNSMQMQITMDKFFDSNTFIIPMIDIYNIQFSDQLNTKVYTFRQGIPYVTELINYGD